MNATSLTALSHPVHRKRIVILAILTALTLGVNLLGILAGLTVVLSHLLYFPIILATYWYPKRGLILSVLIAAIFFCMVFFAYPVDLLLALATVSRSVILVLVGCVVAFLSWNLARSEQQLQDIIEFLPDATFAIDHEGKIIAWNRALELMTNRSKSSMLNRGNCEYALAFYGNRRPMLAGLIVQDRKDITIRYSQVREESGTFIIETFLPHFRGGRGAHLRFSATALLDSNGTVTGAIESVRDITGQVMTASALEKTSSRLNTLTGILRHDISRNLGVLYGHLQLGVMKFQDPAVISFIADIKESASQISHQIEISREFRDIGATPPAWIGVQDAVSVAVGRLDFRDVVLHVWTDRLFIFSDPHLPTVFFHLLHNSLKPSTGVTSIVITYQIRGDGCAIIIEDNGTGIPDNKKAGLFARREDSYARGLYLASEIISLTNMTIRETGHYQQGARFEVLVPSEGYRVEGMDQ